MKLDKIDFQRGMYDLNSDTNFNYQLNRVIMWDGGDINDIKEISHKIHDSNSWKHELINLGDKAVSENRIKEAIAYYRMSEFFMYDGDEDKLKYYELATKMFYEYYREYFEEGIVKQYNVKYEDVYLPVMHIDAEGEKKDTLLIHGGNDSYFEELFVSMLYLSKNGYEVYLFEGPGQGGVLRIQGKCFTYEWEKPVSAIIDYFKLDDITIIGISLGGMLAPRAAAFNKHIKRVVAWSVFPNFLQVILEGTLKNTGIIVKSLLKMRMDFVINIFMHFALKYGKNETIKWGLIHGMNSYGADSASDYLRKMDKFQITNVAHLIDQDILILGANKDHFIDYHSVGDEINSLSNVKSLSFKLLTDKEDAGSHCNMGNSKLALDEIMNWIEFTKEH